MEPTSIKPYLIRAINEWCIDNGYTPYLSVSVDERTVVPREHVHQGEIVLNVAGSATNRLVFGNEWIEFQARFGGVARELKVPVDRVRAIYSRETSHGMSFEIDDAAGAGEAAAQAPKTGAEDGPGLRSVESLPQPGVETETGPGDDDSPPPKPRKRGKPRLTRIK